MIPKLAPLVLLFMSVMADAAALVVEAKIPLGEISGRIDHLAFDPDLRC